MKTLLKYYSSTFIKTASLFIVMLAVSCNSVLDVTPTNQLTDAAAFTSPARIEGQMLGLYAGSGARSGALYSGRFQNYVDIRGEDLININSNAVTNLNTWNHTVNSFTNEVANCWTASYLAINRINIFIEGINTAATAGTITNALRDRYRGEALFLRALMYYSLAKLYCRPYVALANPGSTNINAANSGLPLRLQAETGPANDNLARSTLAETYARIVSDLNESETLLPAAPFGTAEDQVSRAQRTAPIALKTRVYLHMGQWANVITEATKIVGQTTAPFSNTGTGRAHALNATYAGVFASPYTSLERIFSFRFGPNDGPGVQNGLTFYYAAAPNGGGEYALAPNFLTLFPSANDARRTASFVTVVGPNTFSNKFLLAAPNGDHVPVIRYAEVLLNYAEALQRQNPGSANTTAVNLLNAVRTRSAPADGYTVGVAPVDTEAGVINQILLERRLELFIEGFRYADLARLGLDLPAKGSAPSVAITEGRYLWPIPQVEIDLNQLMVQNPGL